MPSVLLLNIGNTQTQWAPAAHENGRTVPQTLPTSGLCVPAGWQEVLDTCAAGTTLLVACVVPAAAQALRTAAAARGLRVRAAAPELMPDVDLSAVDVSTVGADRLANVAAAAALLDLPAIVLDCGTAITTEIVDARRRFLGGAIAPGRRMLRQALHRFTGQLPEIELIEEVAGPIGRTTRAAILAGVDLGALGTVARLIESTRSAAGFPASTTVVAVGGDARFFAANLDGVQPGPPDFTLRGLAAMARHLETA